MLLLSETYDPNMDPTGYWLSEKLDGIRAMWDGQRMVSRNGNAFAVPEWFLKNYPSFKLDGELWLGRGRFNETSSIVRSSRDKGWNQMRYMAFDIPEKRAGVFEDRQKILAELKKVMDNPFIEIVPQTRCPNKQFFNHVFELALANGAEGIMLRKPRTMYEAKRSSTLLKAKRMIDAEAIVLSYEPGTGKFSNMMGALWCEDERGRKFKVGTGFSDAQRSNPPPIGCKITYRYQELTESGAPRFPAFVAIRDYE